MIDFSLWPPSAEDAARIEGYSQRQKLFDGDHKHAFELTSAKIPAGLASKLYLAADWPKLITLVQADMLFGESPILSQAEQIQMNNMVEETGLMVSLYEACLSASFRGDAVIQIGTGNDGTLCIEEKPAYCYFVERDPDNQRRILSEALAWEREDILGNPVLMVEHHFPGLIKREAFALDGPFFASQYTKRRNGKIKLAQVYGANAPAEEEDTGIERSLLFHIPNFRHGSQYFGQSDYTEPLISNFDSYNDRLTKIHSILDKHSDPKMVVPYGTLDERGQVKGGSMGLFQLPPGSDPNNPRYLTWNGELVAAYMELDKLADLIFKFSEIAPAIFGEDKAGSIESGRAMKFRFTRTIAKIRRKRLYWHRALMQLLLWAQKYATAHGLSYLQEDSPVKYAPARGYARIQWQDGLPKDTKEDVSTESERVQNRLSSVVSAIQRIDNCTEQAAVDELARIRAEEEQNPSGRTTPNTGAAPGAGPGAPEPIASAT